jgi:hypothetical protein
VKVSSDLPDGQFFKIRVQPSLQKYFALLVGQINGMSRAILSHTEGRWPSSLT